ncbi:MAG TPA: DUF6159 family protein [Solirubrobacteraceae bacterium]|jgi:hypothetical protein|nr:DUF6159 family protein [Solirubrobacteraceae bacterium]
MSASGTPAEDSGEGRIARSWRLSKLAWGIVRSDPAILVLAAVSTAMAAAALALVYDLTGIFSGHQHRGGAHLALVTLILAFPLTFISVFFNTAIAAAVAGVLEGRRMSLRAALAVPLRRLGQVLAWSLLATAVGVVLEQIARRLPLVGSLAVRLLGLSWSLASLFAIPILATEGCSAPDCLRRSAQLVKKRWGEGISGNVIVTAWTALAIVPIAMLLGAGLAGSRGDPGLRVAFVAITVIAFAVVMAASGVLREAFNVVLYRYAVSGNAAGGFSASDLESPFARMGSAGAGARARRPLGGWRTVWPWLVSAAIAVTLATLVEVNKRHYAAHRLSGRVGAAVVFALALALVIRGAIWLASRAARN